MSVTGQLADQIARLTANCFTQSVEEECRRMARLDDLHASYLKFRGDPVELEKQINRRVREVEQSVSDGEY